MELRTTDMELKAMADSAIRGWRRAAMANGIAMML